MSTSPSIPHLVSRPQQRSAIANHGLYLVPQTNKKADAGIAEANFLYRIAAVGAALFLAMTIC